MTAVVGAEMAALFAVVGLAMNWLLWTGVWKGTNTYFFVEHLLMGVVTAHYLLINLDSINVQLITRAGAGEWLYIIPFLYGLLYFFIFAKEPWIVLYRIVAVMYAAVTIGLGFLAKMASTVKSIYVYSALEDPSDVVVLIFLICGMLYFIYGRKFEKYVKWPGYIGLAGIYVYIGGAMVTFWSRYADPVYGIALSTVRTTGGIAVPLLIGLGILVEVTVGWRKLLGLKPAQVIPAR